MPNHKYDRHLDFAIKKFREWGYSVAPPLSEEGIQTLREGIRGSKATEIPEGYLDFLRRIDGITWNGLDIYGSDDKKEKGLVWNCGLVGANENWKDDPYLYFANDGEGFYVYDPRDQRFKELSNSGDEIYSYDSFDDLLEAGFENNKMAGQM